MTDAAGGSALPLVLIELVLVMGGVLAFGIWQIRSTRRDRERMQAERARRAAEAAARAAGTTGQPEAATSQPPLTPPPTTPPPGAG